GTRDAKIEYLDDPFTREKGIRRLEIRVHDSLSVCIRHGCANVGRETQSLLLREATTRHALNGPVESFALEQLHDQKHDRVVAIEVMDGRDVRVREALCLACLALQGLKRLGIVSDLVV